jgi:3-deoxy-D-manno-octulosonic-acid transferase
MGERLGLVAQIEPAPGPTLWLQALSVGELLTVEPLIRIVHERALNFRLVISTTSTVAQDIARRRFGAWARVIYFPLDFKFSVRRVLEAVSPSLVVIVEADFWPTFLRACRQRSIPVIRVNGHFNERRFPRGGTIYRLFPSMVEHFSVLLMQSQKDADRILELGADPSRVMVTNNLKFDLSVLGFREKVAELDGLLGLIGSRLIVAGSVRTGEEELLLAAFAALVRRPGFQDVRLLMAPRNPKHFDKVEALIRRVGLSCIRRSPAAAEHDARTCQVILLDSLGELASLYSVADVVFIGGSLTQTSGGHNILEPAQFGKPILIGPYT